MTRLSSGPPSQAGASAQLSPRAGAHADQAVDPGFGPFLYASLGEAGVAGTAGGVGSGCPRGERSLGPLLPLPFGC